MTVCPIALMSGCRKCPVVGLCPLKTVVGDYEPDENAPHDAAGEPGKRDEPDN
ncbi:MAG: hypothetical protein KDC48_16690 [Planctomycetes bacterium]|nr:hypothetical protein [Planctomycetota bacterium]